MIPVVVHYPDLQSAPEGVWWWDGSSRLTAYYTPGSKLRPNGEAVMAQVVGRADQIDVEEFFSSLEDRAPRPSAWVKASVKAMTPIEFLQLMRKQAN